MKSARQTRPAPQGPAGMRWRARVEPALALALSLAFAILYLTLLDGRLWLKHPGSDSVVYVRTAFHLAREGHFLFAGHPIAIAPVYPALLALLIRIWGLNYLAMQVLNALFAGGALFLTYLLGRTDGRLGRVLPLVLVVLVGSSLYVQEYVAAQLTEIAYTFFSLATILALEGLVRSLRPRWTGAACSGLLLAVSYLTRAIGLALIGGGALAALIAADAKSPWGLRWRTLGVVLLVALVPIVVWTALNQRDPQFHNFTYAGIMTKENPWKYDSPPLSAQGLWQRFLTYAPERSASTKRILSNTEGEQFRSPLPRALGWITLVGFGLSLALRRGVRDLYVLAYVGIMAIFPFRAENRFMVPLAPLVFYYALVPVGWGAGLIRQRVSAPGQPRGRPWQWLIPAGALCCALGLFAPGLRRGMVNLAQHVRHPAYAEAGPLYQPWLGLAQWFAANARSSDLVLGDLTVWGELVGARGLECRWTEDRSQNEAWIRARRPDFVVVEKVCNRCRRYLEPLVADHPGAFRIVYEDQYLWLYAVDPDRI